MSIERISRIIILVLAVLTGLYSPVEAQKKTKKISNDSTLILQPGMDTTRLSKMATDVFLDSAALKRPKTAAYYAAALPGLGQIYNKSYWKLPLLYGGAITMGYFINLYNNQYHQFLQAKADQQAGIKGNFLADYATEDQLTQGVDIYRRNRDFLMILLSGLYLIQIVDAHVQAHLMNFDITEDLSLQVRPVIDDSEMYHQPFGMGIFLTIN